MALSLSDLLHWHAGVPQDVLILNAKEIGEFLRKCKIQPYSEHQLSEHLGIKTALKPSPDPWAQHPYYSIRGGMKIPHLHFADQLYLLTEEQWKDFSGMMLAKIRDKLAKTNAVSFDQLMDLASAAGKLS